MKYVLIFLSFIFCSNVIYCQTTYKLYAGQGYTNNIYVFNPITMDTIKFIQGAGGYRMAHCKLNNKIYSTGGDDYIYVVDVLTDSLISTFDPSNIDDYSYELEAIVLSPDQTKLYVADEGSDAFFVLNTSNDSIINSTTLDDAYEIENMVISPDGLFVYAVDNDDVLKINTNTLEIDAFLTVDGDAHGIAISSDGQTIYSDGSAGVIVIDVTSFSIVDTIATVGYFLEVNVNYTRLLGVNESSYIDVTDLANQNTTTISWNSGSAKGIICHPNNNEYFVATTQGVYKIDATSLSIIDSTGKTRFQSVILTNNAVIEVNNEKHLEHILSVYPNPFNSIVTVNTIFNKDDDIIFEIIDISGRSIQSNYKIQNNNEFSFDLSDYSNGTYFFKLSSSDRSETIRVIKQ